MRDYFMQPLTQWLQNKHGRHFADNIFQLIFLKEICIILIQISLKLFPGVQL